ncbi:unnamed protein product, partial [Rotaria sp. Silwood1]
LIYLGIFYILIKQIGTYGIIISNCLNMLLRIITNTYYIHKYFDGILWSKPFQYSYYYIITLILTLSICYYSEQWFNNSLIYICFGIFLGFLILILTWKEEKEMIHYIYCIIRLNRQKKIS